ncbi:MAG: hypothetical protein Kow0068_24170 [Marinilabiliales bacterium]
MKKLNLFTLLILTVICINAYSQQNNINFHIRKSFGRSLTENISSVVSDSTGLYTIITSNSHNIFDIDTLSNDSLQRIYLVKLNFNADIIWVKQIENNQYYSAYDLVLNNDELYVTFIYNDTITNQKSEVRKYDTSGTLLQTTPIIESVINPVIFSPFIKSFDSQNNLIIYGCYSDTIIVGSDTISVQPTGILATNYYVIKLDTNYNVLWTFNLGGNEPYIYGLAIDETDQIYITGEYSYNHIIYNQLDVNTSFNNQFSNIFIAKLSENGDLIWHKEIGQDLGSASNASNHSYDISYDNSLGLIITGNISGNMTFGDTVFNSFIDLNYLAQFDTAGNFIKIRTFDSNNINITSSQLSIDKNNSIYLFGNYKTYITGTQTFNLDGSVVSTTYDGTHWKYRDLFIFRFDYNMHNANVLTLNNDTSLKYFSGNTITYNNNLVLVGKYKNSLFFNDGYSLNNNGSYDVFVLSIKDSLNSNIKDNILNYTNCNVFPNPTTGKITIIADEIANIVIRNLKGKQIYSGKETEIDLSQHPKGIYIIEIKTDKLSFTKKLILQ